MRLGFDLRPFLKAETGVGVYLRNLLHYLAILDLENEYCLFSASLKDRFPKEKLPRFHRRCFRDLVFPVRLLNFFWYRFAWPPLELFFLRRLDLTHSPTPFLLPCQGKMIVTVHDLFAFDHPEMAEAGWAFPRRLIPCLTRADGIITFSRFMASEITRRFPAVIPSKVKVIPHGLDPFFLQPVLPADLKNWEKRFHPPEKFLVFVGTLEPRKNLERLIRAMKIVRSECPGYHLLLIGKGGKEERKLRQLVSALRLEDAVHLVGYVNIVDLKIFYHRAVALVLPSLVEGFGFPLLEAMACGLPAVVSGVTALPEVGDQAAVYFDPESYEGIARAIVFLLQSPSLQAELRHAGKKRAADFSWEKAAAKTLEFYRQVLGR